MAPAVVPEDEFPEDYSALQMADREALLAAKHSSSGSGGGGGGGAGGGSGGGEEEWSEFSLASSAGSCDPFSALDPPKPAGASALGSQPPPPAAATATAPPPKASSSGGAPKARAVSPLSEEQRRTIAEVMSRFTISPRGGVTPLMEAAAQRAIASGRVLAQEAKGGEGRVGGGGGPPK